MSEKKVKKLTSNQLGGIAQKAFEERLKQIYGKDHHLERLLDTKDVRQKKFGESYASLPKRPADYLLTYPSGVTVYAEVKAISAKTSSFTLNRLETKQLGIALRMSELGGRYEVILYRYESKEFYRITEKMIAICYKNGKSSIPITQELQILQTENVLC